MAYEIKYRSEDEMKNSGIEWLGKIPKEWNRLNIGNVGYLGTSSVDKKIVETEEEVFLLNYLDIYNNKNKTITNDINFMKVTARKTQIKTSQIKKGDVYFTPSSETSDDIGHSAVVIEDIENTLFSYHLMRLSFNKCIDNLFKKYLFNNYFVLEQFSKKASGTTRKTLTKDDFKYANVLLPPISDQQKIANFLDIKTSEFDSIISKKEQLVEKLEDAKKSLISEVVTGKVKIVDGELVDRRPEEMKDSGVEWLGMIPKDWEVKRLKEMVNEPLKYGANESSDDDNPSNPRYIRITDFDDGGKLKDDSFKSLPPIIARDFMLKDGDVLFARSGATVGKTFQYRQAMGKACFAGYLIKASPNSSIIKTDYLYYFTKTLGYENWKNSIFIQATIQNIGASKYNELKLCRPNIKDQGLICNYLKGRLNNLNSIITKTQNQITKLKEAKQSLISEAVTGKIDLRDWEIIKEEV